MNSLPGQSGPPHVPEDVIEEIINRDMLGILGKEQDRN
jgi:hypothetical protein